MSSRPRSTRLVNGRIYRSAFDVEPVDSLVVSDGVIVFAGARDAAPAAERTIDLGGSSVIPGLTDAHIHHFAIAYARLQLSLTPRDTGTVDAVLTAVSQRAKSTGPGAWVFGAGLDENGLAEHRLPTRNELDAAAPHHPVLLRRFCGHVAVANSAALQFCGVTDDIVDPDGGGFGRTDDGRLDGIARESAAEILFRAVPPLDRAALLQALRLTIDDSARMGLTAAVEAAVGFTTGFDDEYSIWQELRQGGALPLRLGFMHQLDPADAAQRGLRPAADTDWQCMTLKYFADGIVGARTAAVSEPFGDTQGHGYFMRDPDDLYRVIVDAHCDGWQVAVHSVGDRATDCVISAYETAQRTDPRPDPRHRIEHFFVPPRDGLARMQRLGALVVMQPSFLSRMRRSINDAFGPRAATCYPGRSVIDAGVRYVASSDAPTGAWSPWHGIADAVTRGRDSGDAIGPGEAISVREAIDAYCGGGAAAMKHEHWRGTLQPGMAADLIALDRDPFAADPLPVRDTQVLLTMTRGEVVHDLLSQQSLAAVPA